MSCISIMNIMNSIHEHIDGSKENISQDTFDPSLAIAKKMSNSIYI